jgi:hypothetical protein
MDAGLYNLNANQTSIDTNGELIVFDTTKRACTGVSISAGVWTFTAGSYLVLQNYDFTRTSGSLGYTYVLMNVDPASASELYGGCSPTFHPTFDSTSGYAGTNGPGVTFIETAQNLTLGPVAVPTVTFTCNAAYSWICPIKLDGPLVSCGLYKLSGDQTNINTAGEQLVWNSTIVACSGVSLASGELTFTSDGLYVVVGAPQMLRTSGTGTSIAMQWTTDATGAGTTAYTVGMPSQHVTGDSTTATGSNAGHIAVVNRSGSNVTIGSNVLSVSATTVFTAAAASHVWVWRLT